MITKRLVRVLILVLVGLASVFLLPHAMKSGPAGIAMQLPRVIGEWIGDDSPISDKEHEILAKDTQFARKIYSDLAGDQILVSIIMSGDDMTNSIHRPERCLPAQGWNVRASEHRVIALEDSSRIEATRLRNIRADDATEAGPTNLTYYWFVGYNDMTASHLMRTGIDLRDRVFRGIDQRWAYVTVTTNVGGNASNKEQREVRGSQLLEDFIKELVPTLKRPDGSPLISQPKA